MQKTAYLPYVDGLRAIAILLVVIYHANASWITGGFIGVDVFFVISGFLITAQISQQIHQQKFTFSGFYLRRFRRLLPAYIVMALATFIIALQLLTPADLMSHSKMMGLAFLSIGNFYLARKTDGYFAENTAEIPFLHTWSLSVEEQFYLVWPFLLLLLLKKIDAKKLLPVLMLFLLASMAFSQWQTINHSSPAYYLLPARFFELLSGAVLALYFREMPTLSPSLAGILSVFGLSLVMGSALFLREGIAFPGLNALPVCLGTVLLIYAGKVANPVSQLLSTKPFTSLGKISYSLYLWHWPLFVFLNYIYLDVSAFTMVIAIIASILISIASWKWVENPFRTRWRFSFGKTFVLLYALPLALFIFIYSVIDHGEGFIGRFDANPAAIEAMEKKPATYNETCDVQDSRCQQVLLIGDSHADHFSPFIHALISKNPEFKMHTQWKPFCPSLIDIYRASIDNKTGVIKELREDECYQNVNNFYNTLDKLPYQYVIIGNFWANLDIYGGYFFDRDNIEFNAQTTHRVLRRSLYQSLQRLLDNGITPVIIEDNPDLSEKILKCSHRKILRPGFNDACTIPVSEFMQQQVHAKQLLDDVKKDFPQVRFITPAKILCDNAHCLTEMNGMPLYRDRNHLTEIGAEISGLAYLEKFGLPFESKATP